MDFLGSIEKILNEVGWLEIALSFLIVFFAYRILLFNRNISIFDPLFYALVGSYFATTVGVLLWIAGLVHNGDFLWIWFCTATFYWGFISVAEPRTVVPVAPPPRFVIIVVFVLLVLNQLAVYGISGIPLFMDSRLSQFSEGGGVGIFSRIYSGFAPVVLFLIFLRYDNNWKRFSPVFMLTVISLILMLSGAKSALLSIFWARYIAHVMRAGTMPKLRISPITFVAVGVATLLILSIQYRGEYGEGLAGPLLQLGVRFLAYGDVYSYSYVNDILRQIAKPDSMAFFYPLLQPLRIISPDALPIPGFELYKAVYQMVDPSTGPNPRLPVYLDFFYSRWLFWMPFFLGFLLGMSRKLMLGSRGGWVFKSFLFSIYLAFCSVETDPIYFMVSIFNSIIMFIVMSIIFVVCNKIKSRSLRVSGVGR
ncbi:hypothetical protein [Pandoraea apista]|uniref:hypothetical protein n=1 Tax=Pandoraea apista TaxID=93218 RepID=UPI00248E89F3|nr:hypothetical protein [Pandoraea apista]